MTQPHRSAMTQSHNHPGQPPQAQRQHHGIIERNVDDQLGVSINYGPGLKPVSLKDIMVVEPVTLEVNEFTPASAQDFENGVARALRSQQKVLVVTVDSYGGQVYSLFRMLDAIKAAQRQGLLVVTASRNKSMSCGSVLFAAGDRRFVGDDSTILIHDVSSFAWGRLSDLKNDVKHTETLSKRLLGILDKACNKPEGYWHERLHDNGNADIYLNAEEALAVRLATDIGTPRISLNIGVEYVVEGHSL